MQIYDDNSLSIGKTPLVRLNRVSKGIKASILAKVEGRNPSYSVKCRIGASMIWDAERRGILKPGTEIIEATSGNTGIALAFVAAARGYSLTLTMPDNMSTERTKLLRALGAKVVLTETETYMQGAIEKAREIISQEPGRYFMPMQFENPANPEIHEKTTGKEIWDDTEGNVDMIVAGIGTGGTITGISRYIKKTKSKNILSIGVEPNSSPVISETQAGRKVIPGFHNIQGIGAGFIPRNLDLNLVDGIEKVDDEEAIEMARRLSSQEGILCGISSGAAVAAALRLAQREKQEGKVIVVVLPDSGERYLTTELFDV